MASQLILCNGPLYLNKYMYLADCSFNNCLLFSSRDNCTKFLHKKNIKHMVRFKVTDGAKKTIIMK